MNVTPTVLFSAKNRKSLRHPQVKAACLRSDSRFKPKTGNNKVTLCFLENNQNNNVKETKRVHPPSGPRLLSGKHDQNGSVLFQES